MSNEAKTIGIASDHAGVEMKAFVKQYLALNGYTVKDFGTGTTDSCDYPDYAHPLAEAVEAGECSLGVAMCGTGEGMAMTLNKHKGIRAALCWQPEIAHMTRLHNDANILVMPARFISNEEAAAIMDQFFATQFEGGRHINRINKMSV